HMLDKTFDPKTAEPRLYEAWEKSGGFAPTDDPNAEPFSIVIPPPNVTGSLHIGHALNNTLQDVLIRFERMRGKAALWLPGTDHAGIATQMVVERQLAQSGNLSRRDLGRDDFVAKVWEWKAQSGGTIVNQLKRLGASCDWSRERFTLDEGLSAAVRKVFVQLHKQKLIYRDKRLVNWDPHFQTAISDLEVEAREVDGHFWHFAYPLEDGSGEIVVATTRPETMLADTAVAVHPSDERYKAVVGKAVRLPIVNRPIPIIADEYPDPGKGSGAVKITPAHDFNDFMVGKRHNLPVINIFDDFARLNDNAPPEYRGLDRFEARRKVVEAFEALGLLREIEKTRHTVPHGDRSGVVVEPYLTDQWYVAAEVLAKPAIKAVEEGDTVFVPKNWEKTYFEWMRNIQPWCVSRQLWWGHRIPAWYGPDGRAFVEETEAEAQKKADEHYGRPVALKQDEDVLDTWFSSALWPHATLGWPDREHDPPLVGCSDGTQPVGFREHTNAVLDYFYPGSVLVTSRDIITLWVARMVLTGLYNMGDVPFKHVHVHPKILDGFGQGMSKSKGNGVDPLDLIARYGADGLRFTIASFAGESQDVRLPISYACPHCDGLIPQTLDHQKAKPKDGKKPRIKCPKCKKDSQYTSANYDADPGEAVASMVSERFEYGRNFCNKLWNACRFAMLNLEGYTPGPINDADLTLEDRWILSRLATVTAEVTQLLDKYQFDQATKSLREFVWNEFCDWYLEMIKPRLRIEKQEEDRGDVTHRLPE
ncbi:MAG: valine--tRNA ligase, partial [Phenylobacterium sp.]|nr:valine--tRNA ligase [Phenylobacterium sp.]